MMANQSRSIVILLIGLASIFIIISGIRSLAVILNPLLLSIVITITLIPLPGWFAKHGVPGWLSLVLTFIVVLAALGLVLLLVFVGMGQLAEVIPTLRETAAQDMTTAAGNDSAKLLGLQIEEVTRAIQALITSQRMAGIATALLTTIFGAISQTFLVLLIFAFMLSSALAMPSSARMGLRTDHPLLQQVSTLTAGVRRYITLTTALNFLTGAGNTILLLVLGVDLALLWGLLSALMGYIPVIGFWFAMIPPLVLAYITKGPMAALTVLIGYALINGTVENLIKPRVLGQQLKISPAVVVIALFVWGWLLGAVGAILSTPLTLLILSIMEMFDGTRWVTVLLRTAGTGEPEDAAERQAAFGRVRGLWGKTVAAVRNASSSTDPEI